MPNKAAIHADSCECVPCKRKKEAFLVPTGAGGKTLEGSPFASPKPLNADIFEIPGNTIRDRIATWIQLRQQEPGITNIEASKRMGLAPNTLTGYITVARKEGWLTFTDPMSRIEHEIIPQVIDNLSYYLSKEGGRDKQVTIETAKGTVFKQYQESKGISDAPQTVLALKIETLDHAQVKAVSGHVVGKARVIDITPLEAGESK